jgi:DNA invertase Pin-like site-specific DNA recombinase
MIASYLRADKDFENIYEQLKFVNAYKEKLEMSIEEEMVDHLSQNKRLSERESAVEFFRSLKDDTLLVYDVWVLSTNIEDIIQMFSCLLKNNVEIHFIKQGIKINAQSDIMVVMGLIDQLRQWLQNESKKGIGRPRGSKSSSKFDSVLEQVVEMLKEGCNVSEISRVLGVSRSSLKDYIESRELKTLSNDLIHSNSNSDARALMIETIQCPTPPSRGAIL